ncbi:F90A1 protein, partial [Crocuta crocuta]
RRAVSTGPTAGRRDAPGVGAPEPPAPARQRSARDPGLVVQPTEHRPRWASREGPQAVSKAHGLGHAQAPAKRPEVESPPPATRRAPVAQPHMPAPAKRWAPIPDETCQSPRKKARWSPFQQPPGSAGSTHVGLGQSLCRPARGSACGAPGAAGATRKAPASVHGLGLQPPPPRPQLDVVRPCTVPPCPPCPQAPGQPVRMVFRRLDKGGWSSSFLAAPSLPPPPERPAHPAQGPPVTHVPQGPCVPVPRSVLYDDLQLSSSLYDYD